VANILLQDSPIEIDDSIEGLILSGARDVLIDCQIIEKFFDVGVV
jgi:hypothetical protein